MQGKQVKEQIQTLIVEASELDPSLAQRLEQVNRWLKDLKPGSLTAKKFVTAFLLQLIKDSKVWLTLHSLSSEEEQQAAFELMTPTERYWYGYIFPKWLHEKDPKFFLWKQKLMAGEFNQADAQIVQSLAQDIVRRNGTFLHRYVADLSMATDLIVSNRQEKPLCVQITSVSDEFAQIKYEKWKDTLQKWEIQRGLFLSYNPGDTEYLNILVNISLYNSDHLQVKTYLKFP
ncbi:hypothetical protein [Oscillatoria salina]|uniref:hypothetical protein n=1 Tax=Oscillatoria salina TaxID=331517 RepID=UPI0013B65EB4|nr:hypothetical protein [Oscillatoria salina]MBZ8183250.1 hypothetical protein [Oscillatoria salina IIICB1]NET88581.1 hypothetical protein [Kamptonema sp. SIO1D9]